MRDQDLVQQLKTLSRLRTINPNGFVTAGNASGINDGAAASRCYERGEG